jgi:hypothetical protein
MFYKYGHLIFISSKMFCKCGNLIFFSPKTIFNSGIIFFIFWKKNKKFPVFNFL